MKVNFFKWLRALHAWGGVTLTLLFIVISFTGTFLVWKSEYLWLTVPAARAEFLPTPQALAVIATAIDNQFNANDILSIQFATAELPLTFVTLQDSHYAYVDISGNVIDDWYGSARFEEMLYDLHHRLLLDSFGLTVVGFGSMAMLVLWLAGVLSFWPRRKGFRHGLRPQDASRQQLLKTHRNVGILVSLPFLLTLISGIVLVYPGQVEDFLLDELRSTQSYSDAMLEDVDSLVGPTVGDWLPSMERALAVFPEAEIRSVQVPSIFSYYRVYGLQQKSEWNRTGLSKIYIDAIGGYMDLRIDSQNFPALERSYNAIYPLHTGKMDQLWYKILLTISGLGIFVLSSFGLVSFIKKYVAYFSK